MVFFRFFMISAILFKQIIAININLIDIGLKSDDYGTSTCYSNSKIIENSAYIYNSTDLTLTIPHVSFCLLPVLYNSVFNLTINILGYIYASDVWTINNGIVSYTNWSHSKAGGLDYDPLFGFVSCDNISLIGNGTIQGNGYSWWWNELLGTLDYKRPDLINIHDSSNIRISGGLVLLNAPHSHINLKHITTGYINNITIWVDWKKQKHIFRRIFGAKPSFRMFPFNTDGIDVSGENITIENITVENADDVVAIKPMNRAQVPSCTRNIFVYNVITFIGVGMSVGSVPPHKDSNCVSDIIFENITMKNPIKSVYIKSNSGSDDPNQSGLIRNILYKNIIIEDPILWPIYIGPQQQKEPDGSGDGIWPPTEPRITMTNITILNLYSTGKFLPHAGVIRSNKTNPADLLLKNVYIESFTNSWICQNSFVTIKNVSPNINCKKIKMS